MRLIWFYLLLVLPITLSAQESAFGTVTIHEANLDDGYVLYAPFPTHDAYLIDRDGLIVNQWQSEYPVLMAYLLANRNVLLSVVLPDEDFPIGGTGRLEEYDWEGNLVWSFDFQSETALMHHDIAPMPNGNVLITAYERITRDELQNYGIILDEGDQNPAFFYDIILEIDRQTGDIVWEWHVVDHLIQNRDSSAPNYGNPADNPELLDPHYHTRTPGADRSHINGIDYNSQLDQVLVSFWYTSEIWIIDRKSEQIVYRWGNPAAFNRGAEQNRQLFRQHDSHWLENGNILVFNNGIAPLRNFSEVIEIEPPLEPDASYRLEGDSAYEPLEPERVYRATTQQDFFAPILSGAEALSSGNLLITDGPGARIFEVSDTGEIVWEFQSHVLRPNGDLARIFKARWYPLDFFTP